jgi:asparagine synthase (glutamine-hydrolysing)
MSGIVGIINFNGAPVDGSLLRRLTDSLAFRGPDDQRIWLNGCAGFGHAALQTTDESRSERQPFVLDGAICVVADARIDARPELASRLAAAGESVPAAVTDVELLARAYRAWGPACAEHLFGDFAFALWDMRSRRLFCARDQLGVRSFFYARYGDTLIFSNTLECLRRHPATSDRLNDLAIADFLLFAVNQDLATTSFADIQRLPPAHRALWNADNADISRYWTFPVDAPLHLKSDGEYIERFTELLDTAVADRLRSSKLAVMMSGGLDSPSLAASALRSLRRRGDDSAMNAFTTVFDGFDGNERFYAGQVAKHLGIAIHFRDRMSPLVDERWSDGVLRTPEPVVDPTVLESDMQQFRAIASVSRVMFFGEGPDNALHYEWRAYLDYLVRRGKLIRLIGDSFKHLWLHRRIPLLTTLPRMLKSRREKARWIVPFPAWIRPDFETRLKLRERWQEIQYTQLPAPPDCVRPAAWQSFHTPLWEALFSGLDAGQLQCAIETRHPFVDLRLLRFMLAVPAVPWCRNKYLLRRSMRERLPDCVLRRRKSTVSRDPNFEGMRQFGLPLLRPSHLLAEYVDCNGVPAEAGTDMVGFRINFRPYALNYWLCNAFREPYKIRYKESSENGYIRTG